MECLSRPDTELDFGQVRHAAMHAPLTSCQENMTYLRKKLILEIAQNEFIDESY